MGEVTGFLSTNAGAIIGAVATLIGALLVYWQWRRNPALVRKAKLKQEQAERAAVEKGRPGQVSAYREKLLDELRNLKILDMTKPLDLEALYVEVQVREEEPPRYADPAELERLLQLSQLSQHRVRERTAAPLPPEDALARFGRIVVLGDPGAGKTTLLKHLALLYAKDESKVPVFVELRKFVDSGCERLLDYVALEWQERYGFGAAAGYLDEALNAGSAVLLLDGLDEVLGGAANVAYTKVTDEVDRLATRYRDVPIAVTCRRAGWRGSLPAFRTLEVLDFSWEQIQAFVEHWFADDAARAEGLRNALSENVRMQTLAANPLILSLIAIVYERDLELPERRAALYRRCVEVLLKEWDSHRGIARHGVFTTDRKRDLLQEIAWHFHCRGWRYFPKDELLELIEGFLPTINLPSDQAEAILEEICTHYGLLKEQAHDLYGFLHLTLQEYFAAEAANDGGSAALNVVIRHRHNPWWEEVVLLLAGRLSDASPLLLGILGRTTEPPEGESLAADDDLFHGDLLLAGRCLVGTPRLRTPWLRPRILAELERMLWDPQHGLIHDLAARLVVQIGREPAVDRLLAACDGAKWNEGTVLDALGDLRIESAAPALLRRVAEETDVDLVADHVEALGSLGYRPALPVLLGRVIEFWRNSNDDDWLPSQWMDAIAELGDRAVADRLLSELQTGRQLQGGVEAAVVRLLGAAGIDQVLAAILDESIHLEHRAAFGFELVWLGTPVQVSAVSRAVANEELAWEIRYLLTDCVFEHDEEPAERLRELLGLETLDERVRVGVAAALAELGHTDGVPLLRTVFSDVPVGSGLSWDSELASTLWSIAPRRVGNVLSRVDGDLFLTLLLDRFERMPLDSDDDAYDSRLASAIIANRPEVVARRVFADLRRRPLPTDRDVRGFLLDSAMPEAMAPEVLAYLMSNDQDSMGLYTSGIAERVLSVAADEKAVRWLLEPVIDEEAQPAFWAESALLTACRTARVRAFADGRIVPT